ncbi:MAG: gamma-glutamyl-gamma-aminobutyrate hydrolase family protein [Clostridia bacterium]|nr:gamma-glutamyl-gamma-aminobutyrate hydrolase family protein [Clostridia bacterium]
MHPIICLTPDVDAERDTTVNFTYVHALTETGAIPYPLPYLDSEAALEALCALCDGFVFSGGVDVHPRYYGEDVKPTCGNINEARDTLELRLFAAAYATGKPILGICRGAQLVNVALGGTLHQDLPSEIDTTIAHRQTEPKFAASHHVSVLADTPLHVLTGVDRIRVNSFHHQAIRTLGRGLCPMALADDGVIEAAYLPGERYLRVYQWHPERLVASCPHNRAIFDDFVAACAG